MGLRKHILSYVYPWGLTGVQLVFSLFDATHIGPIRAELFDPRGASAFFIQFSGIEVELDRTTQASVVPGKPAPGIIANMPPAYRAEPRNPLVLTATLPADSMAL